MDEVLIFKIFFIYLLMVDGSVFLLRMRYPIIVRKVRFTLG